MRKGLLIIGVVALVTAMTVGTAAAQPVVADDLVSLDGRCSVPCGPIPVIISIQLDQDARELEFPPDGKIEMTGEFLYYFDVDQDGYGYDPQNLPVVAFKTPRSVDWAEVKVEPGEVPIPVDDPSYIKQDDPMQQPEQSRYEFSVPITVTVTKLREPTPPELEENVRSDGKYRILLAATSNGSTVDAGGTPYGLIEGYGVREMRFTPVIDAGGAESEEPAGGLAPAPGLVPLVVLLTALAVALRRQRA
jgi:hypothetical protein